MSFVKPLLPAKRKEPEKDKVPEKETTKDSLQPIKYVKPADLCEPARQLRIEVLKEGRVIETVSLGKSATLLGRSPDCDLVLEHVSISRHHAALHWRQTEDGAKLFLVDLNSTHGTQLNKEPVHKDEVLIEPGNAVIRLGQSTRLLLIQNTPDYEESDLAAEVGRVTDAELGEEERGKVEDWLRSLGIKFQLGQDLFISARRLEAAGLGEDLDDIRLQGGDKTLASLHALLCKQGWLDRPMWRTLEEMSGSSSCCEENDQEEEEGGSLRVKQDLNVSAEIELLEAQLAEPKQEAEDELDQFMLDLEHSQRAERLAQLRKRH